MCLLLAAAITGAPISENDIWNEKSDTEGVRRATKKTPAEAEEEHRKMKEHLVNNFKNNSWESPFGTPPPAKSDKLAPVSGLAQVPTLEEFNEPMSTPQGDGSVHRNIACQPGFQCLYEYDLRYVSKHHASRPDASAYNKIQYLLQVTPHTSLNEDSVNSWLLQGRDLNYQPVDETHSEQQKAQLAADFARCSALLIQDVSSGQVHAKLTHRNHCSDMAHNVLLGAANQLSSVRAHSAGYTQFSQHEVEDEDDAKHVDYNVEDHSDGSTLIESAAKHVIPDKASTDEVAAHQQHVQATTDTRTRMLQGQTHLHHQELTHLVSVGSAGDENISPVHSASGEMHGLGFHTHLQSTIRLISKTESHTLTTEPAAVSKLVEHLTSRRKGGMWNHARHKHTTKAVSDPLGHLSATELSKVFFTIATAANSSQTLDEASNSIATSAVGRAELTHQLQVGALENTKVAERLVGAVGGQLSRCSHDCSAVLSTLVQIAESQQVQPRVREMALVALLQPVCYDHTAALQAIQQLAEGPTAGAPGSLSTMAMHVRHGLVAHMSRCSKSSDAHSKTNLALVQNTHTNFARYRLQDAIQSKDWHSTTMFAVALSNSKLARDAASMPAMLQNAPKRVLSAVQTFLQEGPNDDAPAEDDKSAEDDKPAEDDKQAQEYTADNGKKNGYQRIHGQRWDKAHVRKALWGKERSGPSDYGSHMV